MSDRTLVESIDLLSQFLQVKQSIDDQLSEMQAAFNEQTEPLIRQSADVNAEIMDTRRMVKEQMESLGVQTAGNDLIQVQRPSSTKWVIDNLDTALAHIADLDRLQEVQSIVTNEAAVKKLAESVGGLDGVSKVTERGFKVVPVKAKK